MSTHTKIDSLLTVGEVAGILGVSQATVWRLADSHSLHRIRVGPARRLVRFDANELSALLDSWNDKSLPAREG